MKDYRAILDIREVGSERDRDIEFCIDGMIIARRPSRFEIRAAAHAWLDHELSRLFDKWDGES